MKFLHLTALLALLAGPTTSARTDTFLSNNDGAVVDVATGLVWERNYDSTLRDHAGAIAYCEALVLAGKTNWRLPNIKELISIVDHRSVNPSINENAFPGTNAAYFWTSSFSVDDTTLVWMAQFATGGVNKFGENGNNYTRCVR